MIEGDYPAAQRNYLAATQSNSEDAGIRVNLTKSYKAMNNIKKAKESWIGAQKLDASISGKYKALALAQLQASK